MFFFLVGLLAGIVGPRLNTSRPDVAKVNSNAAKVPESKPVARDAPFKAEIGLVDRFADLPTRRTQLEPALTLTATEDSVTIEKVTINRGVCNHNWPRREDLEKELRDPKSAPEQFAREFALGAGQKLDDYIQQRLKNDKSLPATLRFGQKATFFLVGCQDVLEAVITTDVGAFPLRSN